MPERQAVITLHPLFRPDVLPFRSLTFASDSDSVNIGRASKRETKNLAPAHHNAWFESRVMSRDHAKLTVSLEKKDVYIRDNGSMHGTLLNDKKITPHCDVKISTGDVLTFGAEVVRASEIFAPLRVRCECQWFDTHEEKTPGSPSPQAPNSFCVPEEDDDVIDVAYDSMPAKDTAIHTSNVDDSDVASDSENHPPEDSTPLTSPSSNGKVSVESKPEDKPKADHESQNVPEDEQGSRQCPIVLDSEQPAVETAFSDLNSEGDPTKDDANNDPYESGNFSGSDGASHGVELDSCDEDEQSAVDEDDSSSDQISVHDSEKDDLSMESDHIPMKVNYKCPYVEENDMEDGSILSCVSEAGSLFDSRRKELLENIVGFETSHDDHRAKNRCKLRDQSPLEINDITTSKSNAPPALPMLNEKPGDLLVNYHQRIDRGQPFIDPCVPVPGNQYGISYLPIYENSYIPYQDGPFMIGQPNTRNNGPGATDFTEVARSVNHAENSSDNQVQQSEKSAHGQSDNQEFEHGQGHTKQYEGSSVEENEHHTMEDFDSMDDLIDWVEEKTSQKEPLKRKADEMEKDSPSEIAATSKSHSKSVELSHIDQPAVDSSEGSFSQDAQPRNPDGGLKCSPSQLSDLQPIKDTQPKQNAASSRHKDQPPRKRAKTGKRSRVEKKSRKGSVARYATTALVGALVGGLGTIAALASLPPEYFQ
ncbi:FHA domain protein [Aspergillus sclerotialis]|uniref:FHA domain protein n=1 Tax=Aspergillus sclerotialis TaxID=2070753 RepID=A0A3A3A030_9EURO|nr:FHA domain protein [Aspergillus sclerotialis]